MFRSRSWFGGGWGRPKNPHSLERLKYLHNILCKNTTVSESNRGILVESLRCIAEILIWGDQNDSSVFDFFLEKNMLSYFLRIMRQKCGGSSYVCVQLLQTLNILFENIRNETSLYYLLSNNHVNSIIVHKFDVSDEEVMAYYISFLKTLSLKLNNHTIHFFYNEHTKDFPLYTEAIKFFNHPETMVRIAVRTLTLNVYRVQDASMLRFIRDRTAAPYFSNLVWFIGKHILELNACVRNDADHQSQQKLDDLVAEHLDHLHYINDILCLNIPDLNDVLTEHLLHKLLIPLYIYSLTSESNKRPVTSSPYNRDHLQSIEVITRNLEAILTGKTTDTPSRINYPLQRIESDDETKPSVSCVVSLFLLSQVFLIITHGPIVHALAWIILQADLSVFEDGVSKILDMYVSNAKSSVKLEFSKPQLSLEKALENTSCPDRDYTTPEYSGAKAFGYDTDQSSCDLDPELVSTSLPSTSHISESSSIAHDSTEDLVTQIQQVKADSSMTLSKANMPDSPLPDSGIESSSSKVSERNNITDEEKQKLLGKKPGTNTERAAIVEKVLEKETKNIETRPFLKTIFDSLDCSENDYKALFALCLLYALINNKGVNPELLDTLLYSELDDGAKPNTLSSKVNASEDETGSTTSQERSSNDGNDKSESFNALLISKLMAIAVLSCKPASKVRLVTCELSVRLLRTCMQGSKGAVSSRHISSVDNLRTRSAALARNFYKCDDIFLDMFEDEYCEMSKRPINVEWLCMDAAILLPPTRTPMSGIAFEKRLPSGEMERARRAIRTFFLIRELYLKLTGKPETQLPLANPAPFVQVADILDLNDSDLISCDIIQKDGTWQHRFLAVDNIQVILVEPDKQRLGWGVAKLVGSLQDLEIQGDKDDPRCLHLTIHKPRVGASAALPRTMLLRAKFKFDDHIRSMAAKQRLTKGRTKSRQKKMQQIGRLLEVSGVAAPAPAARHRPLFARPALSSVRKHSGIDGDDMERRIRRPSGHVLKDGIVVYRERTTSRESSISRTSSAHTSREGSPRARSEDIPLEDIRRNPGIAAAVPSTSSIGRVQQTIPSTSQHPNLKSTSSEETSFISKEPRPKRKGIVETI
ncbi:protein CLEC16A homolog isoform X5 [Pararge aegeria]|uniref:Jg13207 protein n=1 Tax=Pararge aegeria aegeria TaxID=348720 RepID=A0A8S4RFK4_9NEOP|nr:protein CLEC16A homolog isoform X5 [Pararge aegeria]CAH2234784.1 jg13207 [Pararge aegeria aegeria]